VHCVSYAERNELAAPAIDEGSSTMRVELSRYRVREGKSSRVDEWLKMLNDHMMEAMPLLDREEMKLEVIFREVSGDTEYLYWFSVQGDTGTSANDSYEHGKKHVAFGEECIDHDYARRDAQPQVVMVPERVATAMDWDNPPSSAVPFDRREIIFRRK
jgi:uncharacterized protein DUF6176